MNEKTSYKDRKVISIGVMRELTGLTERQIRYYEERKLIFPERTNGGTRKYSFSDVEALMDIANKMEDGLHTFEIRIQKKKQEKEIIRKNVEEANPFSFWNREALSM